MSERQIWRLVQQVERLQVQKDEEIKQLESKIEPLRKAITDAAEILHNTARPKEYDIDKKIKAAWDILDKSRT